MDPSQKNKIITFSILLFMLLRRIRNKLIIQDEKAVEEEHAKPRKTKANCFISTSLLLKKT